jgi:hypothetical protein
MNENKIPSQITIQFRMFNKILVDIDLPQLELEEFCNLVKSFIDKGVDESTFTYEHLLIYHREQLRKKEFWDSQPKSKQIEHFIDCNWLQNWSEIDKKILLSKRKEYLKCDDHNDYHLWLLNNMIENKNNEGKKV